MSTGNDFDPDTAEPELFAALLTPHRSLNRTGFIMVMVFLSVVSFATGIAFLLMGAWPVFGFLGLDVLAIYFAFRVNFRRALASEQISVTASVLRLRRVSHRGHVVEWVFNPLWVRLDQEADDEYGVERLYLSSRGKRVAIGSFLSPGEKASFSKALTAALSAARRGLTYNPVV
ncbi:DUF2244 domain-containing protein [Bradyrhizobium sp. Tv2a-2]|uniref:DUF2244 domain-containing protein n=1 Tax=Bradyrhizobium sp. Tv2a-2 TaxID=113395 RepID=UPI0003FE8A5D|nr:DUF2244 domain-containing protein [Bradyrhizobium sp. Tv2a-2]